MTPSYLTLEQQLELAKKVCKDRPEIRQHKDGTIMLEGYYSHATGVPDKWVKPEVFNPSLTGEDWQLAQACRVIVAALPLIVQQCGDLVNDRQHDRFDQRMVGVGPDKTFSPAFTKTMILDAVRDSFKQLRKQLKPDLLTAASLALLGDKT
jgi:hypothetical protein